MLLYEHWTINKYMKSPVVQGFHNVVCNLLLMASTSWLSNLILKYFNYTLVCISLMVSCQYSIMYGHYVVCCNSPLVLRQQFGVHLFMVLGLRLDVVVCILLLAWNIMQAYSLIVPCQFIILVSTCLILLFKHYCHYYYIINTISIITMAIIIPISSHNWYHK